MLILCFSASLCFAFNSLIVPDDDRILQGKLIDADPIDKIVTFVVDNGVLANIAFDTSSKAFNIGMLSSSGFKDPCFKRGALVKVVLHKSKLMIKELHCLAIGQSEDKQWSPRVAYDLPHPYALRKVSAVETSQPYRLLTILSIAPIAIASAIMWIANTVQHDCYHYLSVNAKVKAIFL